jgi:hypothetical protein
MTRRNTLARLLASALLAALLPAALGQVPAPVLIKEVITREVVLHVGGVSTPEQKEIVSLEASLYVENGPLQPYHQINSREVSLAVGSAAVPPPVTDVAMEVSPTGETVTLD